jgi:transcription termination/antitermination protein NusG
MTTERKLEASGPHLTVRKESEKPSSEHWYALYTRSHGEQLVYSQLAAKGFHVFLPKIQIWSRRAGQAHLIDTPMFPTYLFLRHAMDKLTYLEVRRARGLVRILGAGWDRLGVVPDAEIEAIQKVVYARLPALPHPYLKEGQYVRITDGPLEGTEGIFVRSKLTKGLLVLSVDLLQRSIAVEVDCSAVVVA